MKNKKGREKDEAMCAYYHFYGSMRFSFASIMTFVLQ